MCISRKKISFWRAGLGWEYVNMSSHVTHLETDRLQSVLNVDNIDLPQGHEHLQGIPSQSLSIYYMPCSVHEGFNQEFSG